ncbi:MAG TPA: histidinol-phosphate transaminase, partial [bacterium]|nr:histidinol-phosphate transaminase [bacterium]
MKIKELLSASVKKLQGYKVNEVEHSIKLDDNSSPFEFSQKLREKWLKKICNLKLNRYPDSTPQELLNLLAKLNNCDISNVSLGNGSDEIIQYLIQMFINPSDKILIVTPSFAMFKIVPQIFGVELIEIPLIPTKTDWLLNMPNILKKLKSAKLVFLATPNNPTGNIFPKKQLLEIIEKTKGIIVIDEAYYDYSSFSYRSLLSKYNNLVVMRTFSKVFGLAGCRVGYLLADSEIINYYNSVRLPYNINTLSQKTAEFVLENIDEIKNNIAVLMSERCRLFDELKKIKTLQVYKSASNFILFRCEYAEELYQYSLEKSGILLKLFKDAPLENCIR